MPQIEVTFDIDANGILKVSARDLDTGKEQSITITADDRMSEAEIAQAMRDAKQYAGMDNLRKEALELIGESQSLLAKTQQAIKDAGKSIGKDQKKQLKRECDSLQKLVSKCHVDQVTQGEIDDIKRAKEQLEMSAYHILNI